MVKEKGSESITQCDVENGGVSSTSSLFPYPFIFRTEDQLHEYISEKLTLNKVVYHTKVILGILTLILPFFNVFSVYRSLIYQREDFSDTYSVFHSIIFYGEFVIVHVLVLNTLLLFIIHGLKADSSPRFSKGRWVNFLDIGITLMAFNMLKLVPVVGLNGFNLISTQICICAPIFLKYSRASQIISFTMLILVVFIEVIFLVGILLLLVLVKVYQVSFVGKTINPVEWSINNWLLFIGFAANIINITDTPTVSQLSFMWHIINQTWSSDSNIWLHDRLVEKRKVRLFDRICETIGFVKGFLWVRTMSAIDLHCLVRLPPPNENSSLHI